jgi:PKHD-type hydroxylase
MAYQTVWYHTELPQEIIDILCTDIKKYDPNFEDSKLRGDSLNTNVRNSKNTWISTNHWISGFIWHYAMKVNRENFLYDLTAIDNENIQYTSYSEGEYYNWHIDAGIDIYHKPNESYSSNNTMIPDMIHTQNEHVRKLSFIIQLSDPEDYRGGEVQFLDTSFKSYFAPKKKGTIIFFDSRTHHRVRKIKKGNRKSLVGWIIGPRFK